MKHARSDYDRIQDPDGKIPEDEPVFLLRAQDEVAPQVVDLWADMASLAGADANIISKARAHADRMREWQIEHGAKVPDAPTDS